MVFLRLQEKFILVYFFKLIFSTQPSNKNEISSPPKPISTYTRNGISTKMFIQQIQPLRVGSHPCLLFISFVFSFVPTSKEISQHETETACNSLSNERQNKFTSENTTIKRYKKTQAIQRGGGDSPGKQEDKYKVSFRTSGLNFLRRSSQVSHHLFQSVVQFEGQT